MRYSVAKTSPKHGRRYISYYNVPRYKNKRISAKKWGEPAFLRVEVSADLHSISSTVRPTDRFVRYIFFFLDPIFYIFLYVNDNLRLCDINLLLRARPFAEKKNNNFKLGVWEKCVMPLLKYGRERNRRRRSLVLACFSGRERARALALSLPSGRTLPRVVRPFAVRS